jgi:hypothetical protein
VKKASAAFAGLNLPSAIDSTHKNKIKLLLPNMRNKPYYNITKM